MADMNVKKFAVLGLLYINVGRPQDVLSLLKVLNLGYLFGGATLFFLLFAKRDNTALKNLRCKENTIIKLLIAWMLISALFSVHLGHTFDSLLDLAKTMVLYVGLLTFLASDDDFHLISGTFLLSSLTLTVTGLFKGVSVIRSSVGTNYDPNDLALVIVSCLPFVIYHLRSKKVYVKTLSIIAILASLIQLVSTQSRMGFLLLLIFALLYIILQITSITAFVRKSIFIGGLALLFMLIVSPQYLNRITTIDDKDSTGSGRIYIWKRGVDIANAYPVFGVGAGAFSSAYGRMLKEGKFAAVEDEKYNVAWKTAHNAYLKILVELGYPGLFLYLLMAWASIKRLSKMKIRVMASENQLLLDKINTVQISLYLFLFGTFFINHDFSPFLFAMIFLGIKLTIFENCQLSPDRVSVAAT